MDARFWRAGLTGAAGIVLLLALGCSTKGIQASSSSKSLEEGVAVPVQEQPVAEAGQVQGVPVAAAAGEEPAGGEQLGEPAAPEEARRPLAAQEPAPRVAGLEPGESVAQQQGLEPEVFVGDLAEEAPVPPPALSGEERVTEEIVVAKAEPSEAMRQIEEEMRQEQRETTISGLEDAFFAFDSWKIRDQSKLALSADAEWLNSNPERSITIAGHCDERGTQAYNLVLGEKRAQVVKNYLVELGVNAARLSVTSYGKQRPFCNEQNETCYQQNRRAHLVLHAR
ncbi:OmpA family protein [Nitrospiraceae bacterium AH_259_D15_M11_P09]|nr:OmpA family protein [Nitrospiraceae bacterium AH_259_D15_M11_P09]